MSMMISNHQDMLNNEIQFNPEANVFNPQNDHMTFSITQGMEILKQQLSFDLNEVIKRQLEDAQGEESRYMNFDINNPEISMLSNVDLIK